MTARGLSFRRAAIRMERTRRLIAAAAAVAVVALVAGPGVAALTFLRYQPLIYEDPAALPRRPVAIVFGAGVWADGEPSLMLADRLDAAIKLYRMERVDRLLMSGDHSQAGYDEVSTMRRYALERGVPADRIEVDPAGLRTYDSCYRARWVFGVTSAILVTQRYHLPRALFLADAFGIDAVGLKAGGDSYPRQTFYDAREAAALIASWYEVYVTHPRPSLASDPGRASLRPIGR